MAGISTPRPCGDYRTSYKSDMTIFPTRVSRNVAIFGVLLLALFPLVNNIAPFIANDYHLSLMIQIGYYSIAAIGLNILVGFTGQISLGHGAFFGFGAIFSAYLNETTGIPVFFTIPLAGVATAAVGLLFGIPAARIKGLYLAIATLASQFILEDFYARADWFSGGSSGIAANYVNVFGLELDDDKKYYYLVLFWLVIALIAGANLIRSRDGRALVAVRDHYLSAEVMGINLTKYRILSFGISSAFAGVGGALYGHYLGYVSAEGFTLLVSISFLAMIIIGGLGSIMGSVLGA
ncbi:branched-chain amino acid ABC transporter permease, partial [Candidatus Babeliales bacterium]|nr:branched-chain amino acid ABC transporter permease [Candidatus Babeliales bacterium]